VETNKKCIGEVQEQVDKDLQEFTADLASQLKDELTKYQKSDDLSNLKAVFLAKDDAIDHIEKQIADRNYIRVGRWQLIMGSNSQDFYIKDCKLNGYYRLGATD
jgi:hypothetical protein